MKNIPVVITIVTLYAVFFQVAPFTGMSDGIIFGLFAFSPFPVIYMAYIILKFGKPSAHTFDEKFYDDHYYYRNGREQMDAKD